jgi:hypothetical protein
VVLEVHHRDEQPTGPRAHDPANLIVYCRGCHSSEHGKRGYPR